MQTSITIKSPAKVNFTLDVLSRRPDGFHNIASVIQTVSLSDTITVTRSTLPGLSITCSDPAVPADSRNLAYRAAELALQEAGSREGLVIHLEKQIPSQAGLGGGSSNAAHTLVAVNRLLNLSRSDSSLHDMAAQLGSDVPFFLTGGAATARGRGEALTPLDDAPTFWLVIVKPDANVSTADAYSALDSTPNRQSARATRKMEEAIATGEPERIMARMTNDFEQAIFPANPLIAQLCDDMLMSRCRTVRLCGSGSAMFGVCGSQSEASEAARLLRLKYKLVFVTRTLSRTESIDVHGETS